MPPFANLRRWPGLLPTGRSYVGGTTSVAQLASFSPAGPGPSVKYAPSATTQAQQATQAVASVAASSVGLAGGAWQGIKRQLRGL